MLTLARTKAAYAAMPDRNDLKGVPTGGVEYRDRIHPRLIFKPLVSRDGRSLVQWDAYTWEPR